MGSAVSRPLHLGAEIGGGGSAGAGAVAARARLAESGVLDFVTLSGVVRADGGSAALDVLAEVAPETSRIGLVPTVGVPRGGPSSAREALAVLDRDGRGRAGWGVDVSTPGAEAVLLGLTGGAGERPVTVVDVTVCGTGGLAVAAYCADVVVVRAYSPGEAGVMRADLRRRAAAAGRDPDALRILAALSVDLAGEPHLEVPPSLDAEAVRIGQDGVARYTGGPVGLAEVLTRWQAAEVVDGFHITPVSPDRDLERLVNGTVTLLQHRCLLRHFYAGSALRDHLGLPGPAPARCAAGSRA
ncbi:FMNH2-dependent monooxygenase [Streptomyces sp. NBC_00237]|uniref:FMNH2-dependent monooxygenase n=1 Tax=Streptomyces sp. NBC_00237 TaxID=2975687 RepID=UPI0022541835|nr:FMNH2-dependent monooxygenase [Streptomyces sp. NBC_00237]MCX5202173.1 FMNH2-dependent monooxygenase [Streptomyces sp. NBC_00237]